MAEVKSTGAAPPVVTASSRRPASVIEYVNTLPDSVLDSLYVDAFACITIFRSLPPLAQQYIMRLVCVDQTPYTTLNSWARPDDRSQAAHLEALRRLAALRVIFSSQDPGDSSVVLVTLNSTFKQSLQNSLTAPELEGLSSAGAAVAATSGAAGEEAGSSGSKEAGAAATEDKEATMLRLNLHAQVKWDNALEYMVRASDQKPDRSVLRLLRHLGLLQKTGKSKAGQDEGKSKGGGDSITSEGFLFLFISLSKQLWTLVLAWMARLPLDTPAQVRKRDDIVRFLFRLSFLKPGVAYSFSELTDGQKDLVTTILYQSGLVYIAGEDVQKATRFYPTPLVRALASEGDVGSGGSGMSAIASGSGGAAAAAASSRNRGRPGFIVVETALRLFAYTNRDFDIALLGMFCTLQMRLPNLVVGTITKRSVRNALKSGISSTEIISYLEQNAHPKVLKNESAVPSNVKEQIILWEKERNRLSLQPSTLIDQFADLAEFQHYARFTRDKDVLLYATENPKEQDLSSWILIVKEEGVPLLREESARLQRQGQ